MEVFCRNIISSSRKFLARPVSRTLHTSCKRCQTTARTMQQKQQPNERGYPLLIIPATTFCLGVWQIQRRKWKLNLIEDLERRTSATPVPFPENLEDLMNLEYCSVQLRGSFDHSQEIHVAPRPPVETAEAGSGLMSAGRSKSGGFIITPFKLADRNLTILVNRGWVPREKINPKTRAEGQVEGEVELNAIVRHTERRPQFGGKNDPERNVWHYRDVDAMADITGADPYFVDADRKSTIAGGPIGGQTRITVRNEHLSYIFTWFSLTGATLFMYYNRYWRKLPK